MNHFLHLPTIMVIHACSTLISALLIGNLWRQRRHSVLLGILTFAAAIGFLGTVVHAMRPILPFWMSAGMALGAGALALGLFWQAIAVFEGKRPNYLHASAGTLIWFVLYLTPIFHSSIMFRTAAIALIMGTYSVLGGREIWLGMRREPLPSRKLAAGVHCARGAVWYSVLVGSLLLEPAYKAPGEYADWFVLASLLQTLLVMLSIITLLILALERDERASRLVAERDPLTNLRNRRSFVEHAEARLKRETTPSALLLFDIDHFKQINDTHGHAAGDTVLTEFAAMLEGRMQADWLLARIGGEEFACLIPNAGAADAADIAEAMRRAVERLQATIDGRSVSVTVSIGVAATDDAAPSLDPLLAAADVALYLAKAEGRNAVRIYQPGQSLRGLLANDHTPPSAANQARAYVRASRANRRR
ncbi:GGDEF domain-containing protein [Ciceribacter selenitireducens]